MVTHGYMVGSRCSGGTDVLQTGAGAANCTSPPPLNPPHECTRPVPQAVHDFFRGNPLVPAMETQTVVAPGQQQKNVGGGQCIKLVYTLQVRVGGSC